ncbi:hypothetical protein ACFLUR_01870 [Chloroflexota bacterium]
MPKSRKRKGRFRLAKSSKPVRNNAPVLPSGETGHANTKYRVYSYIPKILLYFAGPFLATLFWERGLGMLSNIPSKIVFALVLFALCVYIGWGVWVLAGWVSKWRPFGTLRGRAIPTILVILAIIISPLTYTFINHFIKDLGSIEMAEFGNDSSQVLVHYGRRDNDWMLTQTTVGELREKPRAALSVKSQDILYIHTEGKRVYVDSILFGGYKKRAFFNIPLARTRDFSISMSNYINAEAGPNKNLVRESPGGFIADSVTTNEIATTILAPPVVIKDNNYNDLPSGWKVYERSTALEIRNEYNIPVLVLEYKNPYEITISGIFITSFGILKVDNSEDVIFQFGSNLAELGSYRVNNVFVHSFIDLFKSERSYKLYDDYTERGILGTLTQFFENIFNIPSHEVKNLIITPTMFPATSTTPNGLLIEFSKKWDDIDPISISVNVTGTIIDQQYAWWAYPNLTGFDINQIVSFRKGVLDDAFSGSSHIDPPIFTYYSLGKPLSSTNSLYLWFVSPNPMTIESVIFQGVYFYREGDRLILDRRK